MKGYHEYTCGLYGDCKCADLTKAPTSELKLEDWYFQRIEMGGAENVVRELLDKFAEKNAAIELARQLLNQRAEQLAQAQADCAAMREATQYLVNGAEMTLESNAEEIECRGDEDCDHCVLLSAIHNGRKALSTTAGSEILEELELLRKVAEEAQAMQERRNHDFGSALEAWRKRGGG